MNLPRHRFAWVAAVLLAGLGGMRAAESAPKRFQPARWLLVVDCSSAMERRAKAVEGVVGELLVSGMNGQMNSGDEIGVWTFNKELHAGVAPLLRWDPAHSNSIAGRTVRILSKQVYRSKSRPDLVLTELSHLVPKSRELTVVLLSDGAGKFSGTPFDDAINTAYAQDRPELARTRMPLITVLRAYHGKYIGQHVSFAPWPIEYPPFPDEAKKPDAAATKPVPPVVKPVEPAKNIIIRGSPKASDANPPEPVATKGGSANLLKPNEAPAPTLTSPQPAEPVKAVVPLPSTEEPAPVVAPVKPAPVPLPQRIEPQPAPKPVELAQAEPAPAAAPPAGPEPTAASPDVSARPASGPIAAASETVTARKWPLILGIGCMWVAIAVALILARRARRAHATSLITRSLDHHRK